MGGNLARKLNKRYKRQYCWKRVRRQRVVTKNLTSLVTRWGPWMSFSFRSMSTVKNMFRTQNQGWWFRNPAITSWISWYGKSPVLCRVLYIPGGCLGFLPATVIMTCLKHFETMDVFVNGVACYPAIQFSFPSSSSFDKELHISEIAREASACTIIDTFSFEPR